MFPTNSGTIAFASESAGGAGLRKKVFYSPSEAAKAVTGKAVNGWAVWLHERAPGDWVKLDGLRK